jgi:phosphate transport system substrate-binding protein
MLKVKIFQIIFIIVFFSTIIHSSFCEENINISGKILRIGIEPILLNLFNKFSDNFYSQISYIKNNNANDRYESIRKICQSDDISFVITTKPLNEYEKLLCKNYNEELIEEKIGYYGFVFITKNSNDSIEFTSKTIFKALSIHSIKNFHNQKEQYQSWNEINKNFPNFNIKIYGPFIESSEFEFLSENFIKNNCMAIIYHQEKFSDFLKLQKFCKEIKNDGTYVGDNIEGRLILEKVLSEEGSYGIAPYNLYEKNNESLFYKNFNGVEPTKQNILNDKYPLSYPILIYYKKSSINASNKLMNDFLQEIKNANMIGKNGLLVNYGLISLEEKNS